MTRIHFLALFLFLLMRRTGLDTYLREHLDQWFPDWLAVVLLSGSILAWIWLITHP